MQPIPFGQLPDGRTVDLYTLKNGGLACEVITYGGALRSLTVPDRNGTPLDIVLGFDTLAAYQVQDKFMGALIGRYANRIANAVFELDGKQYFLNANDRAHHLHGGPTGFHRQLWTVTDAGPSHLTLSLLSPTGHEGYPGDLLVDVTYRLTEDALELDYRAHAEEADTICCLTNHAYWNLNGHDSGSVMEHEIRLFADYYAPINKSAIPYGDLEAVADTFFDLRLLTPMGRYADEPHRQMVHGGGYDHDFVVRGEAGTLRPAAVAQSQKSGIRMEVLTTTHGIQFYTGNWMDGCPKGKGGAPYKRRCGFCLETQHHPNSPNNPEVESPVLRVGEEYHETTIYRFSVME